MKKMGLKLTMLISNFKAGIFSMPTSFFEVNYPLRINLTSVVRKRKLGTQGNILKNRIPLSTIISRLGTSQSVDRFSTLQVILVDRCPVPSRPICSRVVGPAPKKMCYRARSHLRKYSRQHAVGVELLSTRKEVLTRTEATGMLRQCVGEDLTVQSDSVLQ